MRARFTLALAALLLAFATRAALATITIVNLNGPGVGFNDPTPATPVGGNSGTTVGQQRLNLFNHAAAIWDGILQSPIEIRVEASFDPLPCSAVAAVLGSAGPNTVESDFTNAPVAATWFVTAEANRLAGTDLEPGTNDISASFNVNIGQPGCLTGRNWYYGYDGNEGASGIDLLPVLLHEIGHGLGFLTLTDETTGDYFFGLPSVYDDFLKDDVTGKTWIQMAPAERITSAIHTGHLVWNGAMVTNRAASLLGKRPHVVASGAIGGDFIAVQATFGTPLTTTGFGGDLVDVNDGVGATADACETPFVNAGAVAGRIALIDRGTCTTTQKVLNAQAAGATGVLLANNVAGTPPTVSGVAPTVTIPVAGISMEDAATLRAGLSSGTVHVVMGLDALHLAGADDAGQVRMFAPDPDQPGSSVSHWDVPAFPNLLMEPTINADLTTDIDLTLQAFGDMGWFPQLVAVPAAGLAPLSFEIGPNPTRDASTLRFRLPAAAEVEIALFDVAGRRVARLASGRYPAGATAVRWDGNDDHGRRLGAGVYLARLKTGSRVLTGHLIRLD